jgi:hypothetical protein
MMSEKGLVPPDKAALRKAIQINSTLWGGTYNPIIALAQTRSQAEPRH